jgi:hypothetical protein
MKNNKINFVTVDKSLNKLNSKQLLQFHINQSRKFNYKLNTTSNG